MSSSPILVQTPPAARRAAHAKYISGPQRELEETQREDADLYKKAFKGNEFFPALPQECTNAQNTEEFWKQVRRHCNCVHESLPWQCQKPSHQEYAQLGNLIISLGKLQFDTQLYLPESTDVSKENASLSFAHACLLHALHRYEEIYPGCRDEERFEKTLKEKAFLRIPGLTRVLCEGQGSVVLGKKMRDLATQVAKIEQKEGPLHRFYKARKIPLSQPGANLPPQAPQESSRQRPAIERSSLFRDISLDELRKVWDQYSGEQKLATSYQIFPLCAPYGQSPIPSLESGAERKLTAESPPEKILQAMHEEFGEILPVPGLPYQKDFKQKTGVDFCDDIWRDHTYPDYLLARRDCTLAVLNCLRSQQLTSDMEQGEGKEKLINHQNHLTKFLFLERFLQKTRPVTCFFAQRQAMGLNTHWESRLKEIQESKDNTFRLESLGRDFEQTGKTDLSPEDLDLRFLSCISNMHIFRGIGALLSILAVQDITFQFHSNENLNIVGWQEKLRVFFRDEALPKIS